MQRSSYLAEHTTLPSRLPIRHKGWFSTRVHGEDILRSISSLPFMIMILAILLIPGPIILSQGPVTTYTAFLQRTYHGWVGLHIKDLKRRIKPTFSLFIIHIRTFPGMRINFPISHTGIQSLNQSLQSHNQRITRPWA